MTFSYRAYGLHCVSDVPIPGFWPAPYTARSADLHCSINCKEPDWVFRARGLISRRCYPDTRIENLAISGCTLTAFGFDEFFELAYSDGARFFLNAAGTRLWASAPPYSSFDDLATYLRGPVMGFALRRRGITPLHASAACIGEHVILFCGAAGAGKSTTVAALASRGIPILSDDIAALRNAGGRFQVQPGYPWICLWPDAVLNLLGQPDALPQLTPTWEKRYLPLNCQDFDAIERPLAVIYLLAERVDDPSAPRIQPLSAREAVLELVQNTYMNWLLDRDQRAAELDALSKLISNVPVRMLAPHTDPSRIDQLCDLVVSDSEALIGDRAVCLTSCL